MSIKREEEMQQLSRQWLIIDTNDTENGAYRCTASGLILFYDAASDEWVPFSTPYDGAPDRDGRFGSPAAEREEPSGHDWTEGNSAWSKQYPGTLRSEVKVWEWSIADGWDEVSALGLPGLKFIEDTEWMNGMQVCTACNMYTRFDFGQCGDCGVKV